MTFLAVVSWGDKSNNSVHFGLFFGTILSILAHLHKKEKRQVWLRIPILNHNLLNI